MVVVQPFDANNEEVEKNELVDISAKDAQSEVPTTKTDEPCSSAGAARADEEQAKDDSQSSKGHSKPTKRKQVSDSKQPYKRQRGILKLRSKTIRIMK